VRQRARSEPEETYNKAHSTQGDARSSQRKRAAQREKGELRREK